MTDNLQHPPENHSPFERFVRFCLENQLVVSLVMLMALGAGILFAPFDWQVGGPLRNPIPVDAIPDIGENQQIVFTQWSGRSPQDVENQITYPLTVSLLGIPGVKTVRSFSMFGFSSVYVIFKDDVDFYWSRSRILEKLSSLPDGSLPDGVQPVLGPDATAMGQVFWYTLEGLDSEGRFAGGWDLNELRTIQDWYVKYALLSVEGVSEVASVGGFVQEYQVDLDPDRMRINNVTLEEVISAVRGSNRDVGAQSIEVNRVEYLIRGIGFIKGVEDIRQAVIKVKDGVPVFVWNVANVTLGPAPRQGALDKGGAETVGGVVVVRFGANPMEVIKKVKEKITQIAPSLPKRTLPDGKTSQVRIVPFYDRTQLIQETLETLRIALTSEALVTVIVVMLLVLHAGTALVITSLLPVAVLLCFIVMKVFGVDANIVALSGIAIAIGTMVDMSIIICENILRRVRENSASKGGVLATIIHAYKEVGGAVLTAVSTTVVSFLPVFAMEGPEGKLFRPLAFTKTFALIASLFVALAFIPLLMRWVLGLNLRTRKYGWVFYEGLIYAGVLLGIVWKWEIGLGLAVVGGYLLVLRWSRERVRRWLNPMATLLAVGAAVLGVAAYWLPMGIQVGLARNFVFVALLIGILMGGFRLFQHYYARILEWCLDHKKTFLSFPLFFLFLGILIWQGYARVLGWLPVVVQDTSAMRKVSGLFPGLGKEFLPPLDEGSYLFMPTTMPHASIGEVLDILQKQDLAIQRLPEIEVAVGKLGRAQSPLDPAPIFMIETLITYKPEYLADSSGNLARFRYDPDGIDWFRDERGAVIDAPDGKPYLVRGRFVRDGENVLIPDSDGKPFRLWRPPLVSRLNPERKAWAGIKDPDDIWDEIVNAARIPGTTSAAKLQPISARMVMLQSGIRAAMGVEVKGPDLETVQKATLQIEQVLRDVDGIVPETVIADRVIGKPYLEIRPDRQAMAQYGIRLDAVLDAVEYTIGGKQITTTVEGRERYPVRVRYMRELRDEIETLGGVLVPAPDGTQIPLSQLAQIIYVKGPTVIKGEDTFTVGYVLFDKRKDVAEVEAVERAQAVLKEKVEAGELALPEGVSYGFIGSYENQVRSERKLMAIVPVALVIIFIILYLQFKSASTASLVFSGIAVAWSGGFIMIWLYGQPWFLDFAVYGMSMRELFQIHPVNLSVAVWVGFLALFGIASDDGVVMSTYLDGVFKQRTCATLEEVRSATIEASLRRVRPCLMTTATTVLALLPVLTSTGKGADIMVPMAIPTFGGMTLELITMLVVPVLYCAIKEMNLKKSQ